MSKVREDTRTYGATMAESRGVHPISDNGDGVELEMIAARPRQYYKNMSYIINACARTR